MRQVESAFLLPVSSFHGKDVRKWPLCKPNQYNHANEHILAAHYFLAHGRCFSLKTLA